MTEPAKKTRGPRCTKDWVVKLVREHGPLSTAELCERLDKPVPDIIHCCRILLGRNRIHKVDNHWHFGPEPAVVTPRVERYIPGLLEPTKHWSSGIPPERLAAFKLPSREHGRLVYPKEYPQ